MRIEVLQLIVDTIMVTLGVIGLWELFQQGEDIEDISENDEAP